MTGLTVGAVLRRAWSIRPTHLETAGALVVLCLLNLLVGVPLLVAAGIVVMVVVIAAIGTSVEELLTEPREQAADLARGDPE